MRSLVRTTLLAAGVAAAGCGDPAAPRADTAAPTTAPAEAARVEVLPVSYAGLDRAIKEQKGKVVLVDVWSLG